MTVEGETFVLEAPFHVLATANPIEYEGTYPLPEAQLDRFLLRVAFGYPSADQEYDVVGRRLARRQEEIVLDPVTDAAGLLAIQEAVENVEVDESVGRYCVGLAAATRRHAQVLTGASPRGSIGLVLTARAWALLHGRDYVVPEDVKAVARAVLAHRITVKPELWMADVSGTSIVAAVLDQVPTPGTLEPGTRDGSGHDPLGADRGAPSGDRGECRRDRLRRADRPTGDGGAGRAAAPLLGARHGQPAGLPSPGQVVARPHDPA